jgi:hypothetical protein
LSRRGGKLKGKNLCIMWAYDDGIVTYIIQNSFMELPKKMAAIIGK